MTARVASATANVRQYFWNSYDGDRHLGFGGRIAYLALNRLRNAAPYARVDPQLSIADFDSFPSVLFDALPGAPSPSRALCDLFWMQLPWAALERELGSLHVLDLGCGSGRYGWTLQRWSGNRLTRYAGVDLQDSDDWRRLAAAHAYLSFRRGDVQAIGRLIPEGTNLVVSQSTLEHVADDIRCIDQIHEYAHRYRRPLLQIHLLPSQACLWTYLWHGYRQYTPRTLSRITERFGDCSERLVVRLGGDACNALHRRFITWPVLIRRTSDRRDHDPAAYRLALRDAVTRDMTSSQRSPAFYAMLVHSNRRERLLDSGPWKLTHR
jgi:SAM-dependent methyltransferase